MNDPLDPKQAATRKRLDRARRIRAIRGTTTALTVSLVIAFSATVAQRHDLGETASASAATTSPADPTGGSEAAIAQPERLVTSQS